MKRVFKFLAVIVGLTMVILTGVFLYSKAVDKKESYTTTSPVVTSIVKKVVASGTIVPRNKVEVKPKISGIVEDILVNPGDEVKKGDLIAKISINPNLVELSQAESGLEQAKISFANAEREYKLQQRLHEKHAISTNDFQRFKFDYDKAEEALQAAKNRLKLVKLGSLGKTYSANEVRATMSGIILSIPVKVGGFVIETNTYNEGTTMATIADLDDMLFVGQVDESEAGKLQEGMDLILYIGALDDAPVKAKLEFIAPEGQDKDGAVSFEIKARILKDTEQFIRAGYSANAHIILDRADSVLAVKERLLQFDENEKPYLMVEKQKDTFEKRYVKLGLSDGINVQVSGISQQDNIQVIPGSLK